MSKLNGAWFQSAPASSRTALRMFCFPYAGGSAVIYKKWAELLPATIQVISVELPGRGPRLQEPAFVSVSPLIEELGEAIQPLLDRPFVLFGHSMGAVIAFELARSLRRRGASQPRAVLVSGHRAPQVQRREPITYNLPQAEFIEELIKLDGTPKGVIENVELLEIMIPLLRADFQLVQTYEYSADAPLPCPIIAYGGLQDHHIPQDLLAPWKELTVSRFALHMLPGDHFFIRSSQNRLLELLARELGEAMVESRVNRQET
jgi:medium-chain acyl-[acyl-carrier-protein] hydrolase